MGLWGWPGALQVGAPIPAAIATVATVALVLGKRRIGLLTADPIRWAPRAAGRFFSAIGHELARIQDMLQRVAMTITRTLEGEAGILWSLVVLVLFVSLIVDRAR